MIYIDSCVPMYLVGADHPLKTRTLELATSLTMAHEVFVTSAEAFQEILHRYRAINDLKYLQIAYEALEAMVTNVFNITKAHTDQAKTLLIEHRGLSSRDCLHTAVMKQMKCSKIWTYDKRFDEIGWITRIE